MKPGERRRLTVYVNVSRPLITAMNGTKELQAMLKDWLQKEGVTEEMLGIDGGYSGSSPEAVFRALDPNLTSAELDEKVRLVETGNVARRFDPAQAYSNVVAWMERLPKFSERSEKIARDPAGKYYVVSKRRSPAERLLAWTVQHAVWRELINHEPVARKPAVERARAQIEVIDDEEPIEISDTDIQIIGDDEPTIKTVPANAPAADQSATIAEMIDEELQKAARPEEEEPGWFKKIISKIGKKKK